MFSFPRHGQITGNGAHLDRSTVIQRTLGKGKRERHGDGTVTANEKPHRVHAEVCKYRAQGRDLRP